MISNADFYHDDGRQDLDDSLIEEYVRNYCDEMQHSIDGSKRREMMVWLTDEFGDLAVFSDVAWVVDAINTDPATKLTSMLETVRDYAIQCIQQKAEQEL